MNSPFPGMDPFLEDTVEWSTVHAWLITEMSSQLAEAVSPNFFVRIEQRVYIVSSDDPLNRQQIVPDVYIIRESPAAATAVSASPPAIHPPTLVEPVYSLETRDRYIEIRDTRSREVVTTIELLSPFNKTPGHQGFDAFQEKRQQVMASQVHWLEIDLLRAGERPPEVAGKSDYYALLKRGDHSAPYEVWYFDLRDRMPTIAVPLRPPFIDVPLDLQAAFEQVYARAHYADSLDYTRPVPRPRLRPADAQWIQERLHTWQQARDTTPP